MPEDYERWEARVRGDVSEMTKAKEDVLVSNLNEAAKAALMKVLDRLDSRFDRKMAEVNALNDVNMQLRTSVNNLINCIQSRTDSPTLLRTLQVPVTETSIVVRDNADNTETTRATTAMATATDDEN